MSDRKQGKYGKMIPLYDVSVSADLRLVEIFDRKRVMSRVFFHHPRGGRACSECAFAVERMICEATGCAGWCYLERDHAPRSCGMDLATGLGAKSK